MKRNKFSFINKVISVAMAVICSLTVLVGCKSSGGTKYRLSYYDCIDEELSYNESLFYYNDMPVPTADPTCIYIDDENDKDYGWFYMYPTSGLVSRGIVCYRSRDMRSWEWVGPVFEAEEAAWMESRFWAPEVIYDEATKKYYLFGSASNETELYNKHSVVFYSEAEKEYWYSKESEVEALIAGKTQEEALPILQNIIDERKAFLESVTPNEEASDGRVYTQERIDATMDSIRDLKRDLHWADTDKTTLNTQGSSLEHNYTTLLYTAICASAADVSAMKAQLPYALYVAVSDSPRGPFVQYTNVPGQDGYDETSRTLDITQPFIGTEDVYPYLLNKKSEFWQDFTNGTASQMADAASSGGQLLKEEKEGLNLIDIHPYQDPVTGKKYFYAAAYTLGGHSFIIGMEAGEKWTDEPKWETLTRLTRKGYYTANDLSNDNKTDYSEKNVNEGPFMYYRNGTYYLTLSVNNYTSKNYSVIQAVSDSPLGPFRKLSLEEGGKVIGSELHWDHIGGPGHHSFVEYDEELYIVYHSHYNREGGTGVRGSCFDPIVWTKNAQGQEIMHCNGPTYSLQPKCGPDMEYKNIAVDATITVKGAGKNSDTGLLNDRVIRFFSWDEYIQEFECGEGKTTITLTFDDYRTLRALMVYNSFDYAKHFRSIEQIEFDAIKTIDGKEQKITAVIQDLQFDVARYINEEVEGEEYMRPGGAAIAEFDELSVKEIRITMDNAQAVALSEIYVLGK